MGDNTPHPWVPLFTYITYIAPIFQNIISDIRGLSYHWGKSVFC